MGNVGKVLWPREKALEWVRLHRLTAVIRARNAVQAQQAVEAACRGGFKLVEVPMTLVGAADVIREFFRRPGLLVGAGAVLTEKSAGDALDCGAQFLMTPHTDPAVLKLAKRRKVLCGAGCLTPTEVVRAWSLGADLVRIFPVGSVGGPEYVQFLKEPFPDIPLMPAGGITLQNLRDYLLAGATAVGVSRDLFGDASAADMRWADVTARARQYQEILQKI